MVQLLGLLPARSPGLTPGFSLDPALSAPVSIWEVEQNPGALPFCFSLSVSLLLPFKQSSNSFLKGKTQLKFYFLTSSSYELLLFGNNVL